MRVDRLEFAKHSRATNDTRTLARENKKPNCMGWLFCLKLFLVAPGGPRNRTTDTRIFKTDVHVFAKAPPY